MVERTTGSIKNYVLTYLREDKNQKLNRMIPREANTIFRNLTKKPSLKNLDWTKDINQKLQYLDEANGLPEVELNLDWEKRSDMVYAPHNRKTPRVLEEHALAEADA